MKRFLFISERVLVALIVAILFTPFVLSLPQIRGGIKAVLHGKSPYPKFKTNPAYPAAFAADTGRYRILSRGAHIEAIKKEVSERVNTDFIARDFLLKWTSETWFRLFRQSAAKSANLTVGNQDQLFENVYLKEYCITRVTESELQPTVDDLKRMQDICKRLGMTFVMVITPSKASIFPEAVPKQWMKLYDASPRGYDVLIPMLKKAGIHFVDGHALAMQVKATAPAPLFPKGGIHWGQYAALLTTNAMLEELKAQGMPVVPLKYKPIRVVTKPQPGTEDCDILGLMKLAKNWRYPVAKVDVQPNPPTEGRRPAMAVIGGSFSWRIVQQLVASEQFAEINSYFYYKLHKASNADTEHGVFTAQGTNIARIPTGEMDFNREIYGADGLILELNEALIPSERHIKTFLKEALSQVPEAGRRGPFLYESLQPYQWGRELSFRAAQPKPLCLNGFCSTEIGKFTWTNGPVATVRLAVPPAKGDLLLKAELGALIIGSKLPKQAVKVFANGFPAGQWEFTDGDLKSCEVPIRKDWVRDGVLILRFEIANPKSPERLKLSADNRELGVRFSSLRVEEKRGVSADSKAMASGEIF